MTILQDKLIKERLYKYNPSSCCGVFMPEMVMKKLAKLTFEFESEVKRILTENADSLYTYEWGLSYPNGEQKTVEFATKNKDDIDRRIELFKARQAEYVPTVYLANPYQDDGKAVIKAIEELEA